jgi:sarcosine oxidase gamma subunit
MISVAVSGYGLVIWEGDDEWRVYAPSDSASATLAARVEMALDTVPAGSQDSVRDALLSISGAWLLAADCDHGPGGCDTDHELN